MSEDKKNSDAKSANGTPTEEVGYGRPPKSGRFSKGQSGNPSGARRKRPGEQHIRELFLEVLFEPLVLGEGARRRKAPLVQWIFRQISTGSLKEKSKSSAHLIRLMENFRLFEGASAETDSLDDMEVITEYNGRFNGEGEK